MSDSIEAAKQAVAAAEAEHRKMIAAQRLCRDGVSRATQALEAARHNLRKALQSDQDRLAAVRQNELTSLAKQIEELRHV